MSYDLTNLLTSSLLSEGKLANQCQNLISQLCIHQTGLILVWQSDHDKSFHLHKYHIQASMFWNRSKKYILCNAEPLNYVQYVATNLIYYFQMCPIVIQLFETSRLHQISPLIPLVLHIHNITRALAFCHQEKWCTIE